jgi:hypothetical protein
MHPTSTPTTSTPLKADKARRRAGTTGVKFMLPMARIHGYTDFFATNVYTNTYTEHP